MAHIKAEPKIIRHVSLTRDQDAFLRQRAEACGMEIVPYIRHQALKGCVNTYAKEIFEEHAEKVSKIYEWMRMMYYMDPDEDPVIRAIDKEMTDDSLDELLEIERQILEALKVWL